MFDVIVIGGGIVGMSVAYHLVRDGARTLLVDRADVGRATAAGAGIISPETSSIKSDEWFNFGLAAAEYYPTLVAQLQADGAGETGYAPMEQLIVAVSADEDESFASLHEVILARQKRLGRPAVADFKRIDATSARTLFPPLAAVRSASHVRRTARVDGRLLTAAMREAAIKHGLMLREANVTQLVMQGAEVQGVQAAHETFAAGAVVIAGGAWTEAFAAQLHVKLPIVPQRGQIIHLSLPGVETATWPSIIAFHGHYMLPWSDSRVVVGATREFAGFAPHTTAAGVQEVLREAVRVAPGLANANIADVRVGLRPSSPDNLPVLGAIPTARKVYVATGHGASGLQLGPFSGKLIATLAQGKASEVNVEAFGAERFQ